MKILLFLTALAVCCLAAPSSTPPPTEQPNKPNSSFTLQRPSPINPDVPMEPKPAEKITVITDPTEIVKHKRAVGDDKPQILLTPTVSPAHSHEALQTSTSKATTTKHPEHNHAAIHQHRAKRDQRPTADSKKVQTLKTTVKPVTKAKPPTTAAPTPTSIRPSRPKSTPVPRKHKTTVKSRRRRDVTVASTTQAAITLPLIFKNQNAPYVAATPEEHLEIKRDIPVPLVSKHQHHAEESAKLVEQPKKAEDTKPVDSKPIDSKTEEKKPLVLENSQTQQDHKKSAAQKDAVPKDAPTADVHHITAHVDKPHQHTNFKHDDHQQHVPHPQHESGAILPTKQQYVAPTVGGAHTTETASPSAAIHAVEPAPHSAESSITSANTADHPLFRHKPLPVAELFARSHGQS